MLVVTEGAYSVDSSTSVTASGWNANVFIFDQLAFILCWTIQQSMYNGKVNQM